MLERAAASGESVLLLRQRPKEDASRQFLLLNEQISLLSRARHELESRIAIRTSDLTAAQTALRELSAKLLRAQDDERRRLARDLHDSTGQLLTAMLLNLSVLMQDAAALPAESVSRLSETVELANQAITEIRTMSYLLHPPMLDEAGLEMALQWYVDGFRKRSNIRVYLSVPTGLHRLDRDVELAVFRIVQECLTNIHRHSGSALAQIMLGVESGKLILVIRDEGRGLPFPPGDGDFKQSGVGIRGMQERVRQLDGSIQFQAGNPGTLVRVELPLSGRTLDSADQSRRAAGLQPD
jgi:signal transduction histidine kinase